MEKLRRKQEKQGLDVQAISGLPIHNYFSAVKLRWMIKHVAKVKEAVKNKRAMFGTVDSWLIWVRNECAFMIDGNS